MTPTLYITRLDNPAEGFGPEYRIVPEGTPGAEAWVPRAELERLRDMLADAGVLRDAADRVSEWFAVEARHLEGPRINALRMAMVAYDRHCQPAALAALPAPPGAQEEGV